MTPFGERLAEGGFLYTENHWLGQWFKKAYGDE